MWNPVLVTPSDVPSAPVDTATVEALVARLEYENTQIRSGEGELVEQWGQLQEAYRTGHTELALGQIVPVSRSTTDTHGILWEIAWILNRYVSELRACESRCADMIKTIKKFNAKPKVSFLVLTTVSPEFWRNLELMRAVGALRSDFRKAEQRCATSLAGISKDHQDEDLYENLTWVFKGGHWIRFLDRRGVELREIEAPLFGKDGEINGSQVSQGDIGNCWFMSSLAAIADSDPDAIRRMVRANPDGSYSVSLFIGGNWQSIEVTNEMLVEDNGALVFAGRSSHDEGVLWPLIVEKAAIKAHGGNYTEMVANTGSRGMEMLTGNKATFDIITANTPIDLGGMEKYAEASKDPHTVITAMSNLHYERMQVVEVHDSNGDPFEVELDYNHVYQVKDISSDGRVTLVNPHNSYALEGGVDYDQFSVSADQFKEHFVGMSMGSTR